MATAVEPHRERKRRHWRWSAYLTAAFFLVLASIPSADERDEGGAYVAGWVLGTVGIVLAIAFALRAIYVKVIRRDGRPIWSGWTFAIAAALAFLVFAGRMGDSA